MESDTQIFEVKAALAEIRRNTTPGPDQITNKALANLDLSSVTALTSFMRTCWRNGKLPAESKTAEVRLIPKPGKKPDIGNLHPISLTSIFGELLEHVIPARLQSYLEDTKKCPATVFGFRPHLST